MYIQISYARVGGQKLLHSTLYGTEHVQSDICFSTQQWWMYDGLGQMDSKCCACFRPRPTHEGLITEPVVLWQSLPINPHAIASGQWALYLQTPAWTLQITTEDGKDVALKWLLWAFLKSVQVSAWSNIPDIAHPPRVSLSLYLLYIHTHIHTHNLTQTVFVSINSGLFSLDGVLYRMWASLCEMGRSQLTKFIWYRNAHTMNMVMMWPTPNTNPFTSYCRGVKYHGDA